MTDKKDTPAQPADSTVSPTETTAVQPERSRTPGALAITGIVLGSVLTLGLVFAGGVGLGRILPDHRGPIAVEVSGPFGGQLQDRIDDRMDDRDDRRDDRGDRRDDRRERFEQWLNEQGIEPGAPAEPTD